MRRLLLAAVAFAVVLPGCGYHDSNPDAARVVARAFLNAYADQDPDRACAVLGPDLYGAIVSQNSGTCPQFVGRLMSNHRVRLQPGRFNGDDVHGLVSTTSPGIYVSLIRYGSIWRVDGSPLLR
jgi:hypothetical protein